MFLSQIPGLLVWAWPLALQSHSTSEEIRSTSTFYHNNPPQKWWSSTRPSDTSNPHFSSIILLWSEQSTLFQQSILVSQCSFQQPQCVPLTQSTSALDQWQTGICAYPVIQCLAFYLPQGIPHLYYYNNYLEWKHIITITKHLRIKQSESLLQYSWLCKKPRKPSVPSIPPSPLSSNGAIEVMWIHFCGRLGENWRASLISCHSATLMGTPPPLASHPPSSSPPVSRLPPSVTRSINFMSADREKDLFTNLTPNLDT